MTQFLNQKRAKFGRLAVASLLLAFSVQALSARDEIYESPASFISGAFPGGGYSTGSVSTRNEAVKAIFNGRGYRSSSAKYWKKGDRTAWILEEIGKHKPITVGVVVDKGKIDTLKVLIYREKIGWEVRRTAFTRQFNGTTVRNNSRATLSRRISNISGATLSVNALDKLGRTALVLHQLVAQ